MYAAFKIIGDTVLTLTAWAFIAGCVDLGKLSDGFLSIVDLDQIGFRSCAEGDGDGARHGARGPAATESRARVIVYRR